MQPFITFVLCLIAFHFSEFLLAAVFNPSELSWESTLISLPYLLAMSAATVEHHAELRFFPDHKTGQLPQWISSVGFALVLLGECLRKAAILTARTNFTQRVQHERRPQHVLVSQGVYAWCRHPGYLGFLLWGVGTQLLLVNPVCTVVFSFVLWQFFSRRIAGEEENLLRFFGSEYRRYASAVASGIPLVP